MFSFAQSAAYADVFLPASVDTGLITLVIVLAGLGLLMFMASVFMGSDGTPVSIIGVILVAVAAFIGFNAQQLNAGATEGPTSNPTIDPSMSNAPTTAPSPAELEESSAK
jgi:hypothetical protein